MQVINLKNTVIEKGNLAYNVEF